MSKREIRIEILMEILGDLGVEITRQQAEEASESLYDSYEMEGEEEHNHRIGGGCRECERKEKRIKEIQGENSIYKNAIERNFNARAHIHGTDVSLNKSNYEIGKISGLPNDNNV